MTIFIIARGYPSPQFPQWGCFERDQAEALAAYGHTVVMLSVDTRFRFTWRKIGLTQQTINGVHSLNFFYRPAATYIGYIRRNLSVRLQFLHIYKIAVQQFGKPDILYAHYLPKSCEAVWLGKKTGIPVVGIEHWSALNLQPLPRKVKWMGQYTYPRLAATIAVAQPLAERIQTCFGVENVHIIHNTFSSDFYYKPIPHDGVFHMVTTGSLLYGKGFDLLVRALHAAQLPNPWELNIIGEGPEHSRLQALIDEHGLSASIHLLGKREKPFIAELLRQSSCFILPSRGENFSVAILEGLACGLPVIASLCGGVRECIDEHNGLLFPVDDEDALVQCLRSMATNYANYNRQAIADDCQNRFSPHVIAQKLTSIFQTVTGSKIKNRTGIE